MTAFEKVLMKRDGMTEEEAREELKYVKEEINDLIACGDYEGVEDLLMYDYGLEMDYILDILL